MVQLQTSIHLVSSDLLSGKRAFYEEREGRVAFAIRSTRANPRTESVNLLVLIGKRFLLCGVRNVRTCDTFLAGGLKPSSNPALVLQLP